MLANLCILLQLLGFSATKMKSQIGTDGTVFGKLHLINYLLSGMCAVCHSLFVLPLGIVGRL